MVFEYKLQIVSNEADSVVLHGDDRGIVHLGHSGAFFDVIISAGRLQRLNVLRWGAI
jgi:hypothetical protein